MPVTDYPVPQCHIQENRILRYTAMKTSDLTYFWHKILMLQSPHTSTSWPPG